MLTPDGICRDYLQTVDSRFDLNLRKCCIATLILSVYWICRKATAEMMCMRCLKVQPVGPTCQTPSCDGLSMAKYYCSICKFFDDER